MIQCQGTRTRDLHTDQLSKIKRVVCWPVRLDTQLIKTYTLLNMVPEETKNLRAQRRCSLPSIHKNNNNNKLQLSRLENIKWVFTTLSQAEKQSRVLDTEMLVATLNLPDIKLQEVIMLAVSAKMWGSTMSCTNKISSQLSIVEMLQEVTARKTGTKEWDSTHLHMKEKILNKTHGQEICIDNPRRNQRMILKATEHKDYQANTQITICFLSQTNRQWLFKDQTFLQTVSIKTNNLKTIQTQCSTTQDSTKPQAPKDIGKALSPEHTRTPTTNSPNKASSTNTLTLKTNTRIKGINPKPSDKPSSKNQVHPFAIVVSQMKKDKLMPTEYIAVTNN